MKKILNIFALLLTIGVTAQHYTPLSYSFSGTPKNGIKIKTNLPYHNGSQMPTVIIEGYNYGKGKSIGVMLHWYIYNNNFIRYGASSHGAYAPPIKLANEGGKVIIFLDSREYFNRFQVRVYAKGLSQEVEANFQGWTTADEAVSGTNVVSVPYNNPSLQGDIDIEGHVNIGGTTNKSLKVRHVNGKNSTTADFDNLYLNYGTGKDVVVGKSDKPSNLHVYGKVKSSAQMLINPASNGDNNSPGITLTPNDDFLYDGKYIHHYGFGFHDFKDLTSPLNGNNTYMAGYFGIDFFTSGQNRLRVNHNGDVGIGVIDTKGFKLGVDGKIAATEVKVAKYENWPDYVFTKEYTLPTLKEVEKHINEKGHLPNIPSAKEVKENKGIELGEMNRKLLEKVEELTLYTIQQEKQLVTHKKEIENSKTVNKQLLNVIEKLEKRIEKLENK